MNMEMTRLGMTVVIRIRAGVKFRADFGGWGDARPRV